GISSSTGPGRPLRAIVKARRRAGTIAPGVLICSQLFVMCWKFNAALNPGFTHAWPREEPAGITTIGTPSDHACATAPNAFSTPGPDCMQNTPTLSPEDKRA